MRNILLAALLTCATLTAVQAKDSIASTIVGTWGWHHMRHEAVVTYKSDGTYELKSASSADGGAIHSVKGTWKIKGNMLIETPSEKGSSPTSSLIEFEGKNRYRLDGFMTFERMP